MCRGSAWYRDLPTRRGIEATPLVVDGVMYTTGSWSMVYSLDAGTGELLCRWHTVPGNPEDGFENAAMERAAETWTGDWWRHGLGFDGL